jgi:hypothetical protein
MRMRPGRRGELQGAAHLDALVSEAQQLVDAAIGDHT